MSLSNSILVNYSERTNGGTTRAIYKLDDKIYTSDLTSVGAGTCLALEDGDAADVQFFYSPTIGGLCTVKACTLLSDKQEIDGFTEDDQPHKWLTMHTLTCSNRESIDINRPELHSGWGFTESRDVVPGAQPQDPLLRRRGNLTLQDPDQDYSSTIGNVEPTFQMIKVGNDAAGDGQDATCTQIDWSRVLPFLRASQVLPKIPKLKLVHQYDKTFSNYVNPEEVAPGALQLFNLNPLLLSNEVLGMELTADSYTTRFGRIKSDHGMLLPAVAENQNGITKYNCTAFNGQYVDNLYFWTTADPAGANITVPNENRSRAMYKEEIQIMVNGFPLLPLDGITQEAEKMLFMHRTKGNFNAPLACFMSSLATTANNLVFDNATSVWTGNMSCTGVHIGAVIDRLQIIHQRQNIAALTPDQGAAATLDLYAECITEVTTPANGNPALVTVAY